MARKLQVVPSQRCINSVEYALSLQGSIAPELRHDIMQLVYSAQMLRNRQKLVLPKVWRNETGRAV